MMARSAPQYGPAPAAGPRLHYRCFGLDFASDAPLPGLVPSAHAAEGLDAISVEFGPVSARLDAADVEGEGFAASADRYLLELPGIVRLLVEHGQRIRAEPIAGGDPVQMWNTILGSGAAIAGFQRGHVPLHMSAVLAADGAVAFAGPSGFGKSTLAAALALRGFRHFSDDLCLVRREQGRYLVGEGIAELRLLDDAVHRLGLSRAAAVATQANVAKHVFRRADAPGGDAPLVRIYSLAFAEDGRAPGIERLTGTDALQALLDAFRVRMKIARMPMRMRQDMFEKLAALAGRIAIHRFVRPRDLAQFDSWLDRLVDHISGTHA